MGDLGMTGWTEEKRWLILAEMGCKIREGLWLGEKAESQAMAVARGS